MNFAALRVRPFRRLWLGQAISQLGDSFYYVVFMFMVKKVTGSSEMVGFVGALESLPFLLFGPHAGVIADRIDRRVVMLASDLASGGFLLLFGLIVWLDGNPPKWALLAIPFLLSTVRCYFMPAKSAAIPALVDADQVLQANALSSMTQTSMPLIGLSLSAGVLSALYLLSPQQFYLSTVGINCLSFLLSAAFIFRLPALRPKREDVHETHPITDFKDGLKYINGRHDLKILTLLLTVFRLMVAPFFVVFLAANDKWLGGKPQTLTWWEFTFFCGMAIASIAMGNAKPKRPLLWFAVGLLIVGLTVAAMAIWPGFWPLVFWNVIAGLAIPPADIPVATYLQLSVPDAFRGRVNSVREMISQGVMPIGMVLGGWFTERYGVEAGFMAMGIGMMAACFIGLADKQFRSAEMPA
ncbi:MAG TPA: MFS transporter [Fimbriimonas sp.]|nr:MFS transporter [Fimbriimonas sp.]